MRVQSQSRVRNQAQWERARTQRKRRSRVQAVVSRATSGPGDAARAAVDGVVQSFRVEPLTSAGFTAAALLLMLVTAGVVYLSYSEWQDRRAERRALEELDSNPHPGLNDDPLTRSPSPATSKGFGMQKRRSVDEQDIRS